MLFHRDAGAASRVYAYRRFREEGFKQKGVAYYADIRAKTDKSHRELFAARRKLNEATAYLADESKASGAYNRETLDKMMFGFRTSEECGTDRPWMLGASGAFKLYEPAWAQALEIYDTLVGVEKDTYKEEAQWENGKPWPGAEAENSAKYAELEGLRPKNLTDEGFNKSRKEVEKKSEITDVDLSGNYIIRKF